MAVEVWSCEGGQGVTGGWGCGSAGEVVEVRELGLSLQLGLGSVSLAGVAVSGAVAVAEADRRAGPMGQVVARGAHRAVGSLPVHLRHVLLPQGHDRDPQCNVGHELPHNWLHVHRLPV